MSPNRDPFAAARTPPPRGPSPPLTPRGARSAPPSSSPPGCFRKTGVRLRNFFGCFRRGAYSSNHREPHRPRQRPPSAPFCGSTHCSPRTSRFPCLRVLRTHAQRQIRPSFFVQKIGVSCIPGPPSAPQSQCCSAHATPPHAARTAQPPGCAAPLFLTSHVLFLTSHGSRSGPLQRRVGETEPARR